jgi:predicted PurR-regulated permease PerM
MDTKRLMRVTLVALLALGCALVLSPFVAAILFAAVIVITTWPLHLRLEAALGGRSWAAAMLMTLLLLLVVLLPTAFLAVSLAEVAPALIERIRELSSHGPIEPPLWLASLPLVGEHLDAYWHRLMVNREELNRLLGQLYDPARRFLMTAVALAGEGLLQITGVLFIAFFFYRDGAALGQRLRNFAQRFGGEIGENLLKLASSTVNGVMIGIVGTAAAQALVALTGLLIAGVPGAMLLAAVTFFLSMVPVGPPLVWGGAAWWLYDQGQTGWAIFMALWGLLAISSVDNFVKPMLISRSASLPILLIVFGVFGGAIAFGFIGIFLGPTLLALAARLLQEATRESRAADAARDARPADPARSD